MSVLTRFELFYRYAKQNRWYWLFSVFCRVVLAFAFVTAGLTKVVGERFASGMSELHPMGAYLTALHRTGYYYTFIGYAQMLAAFLLLIPRTVLLGALLYFPIIVNIWLLSYAVRFEGSIVTSPLMVLANLYLLLWHYDRIRYLLPFREFSDLGLVGKPATYDTRFPWRFFAGVFLTVVAVVVFARFGHEVMPRNSLRDCKLQFEGSGGEAAGEAFCTCVHRRGETLEQCLREYAVARDATD